MVQDKNKRMRRAHIVIHYNEETAHFFKPEIMENYLKDKFELGNELIYGCWAEEIAPKTGKRHLHLLLEYQNAHSKKNLEKKFSGAHIKKCDGKQSAKDIYDYIRKKGEDIEYVKTFHEIGEFSVIENKQTKRARKSKDEIIRELVSQYDNYESCLEAFPYHAGLYRDRLIPLMQIKQDNEFKKKYGQKMTAENGETFYTITRRFTLLIYSNGIDIGTQLRLKYASDISFVTVKEKGKTLFDNYQNTEVLGLIFDDLSCSLYYELNRFLHNTSEMLPCRYQDKKNNAYQIIFLVKKEELKNEDINCDFFNGGVWHISEKEDVLYIKKMWGAENCDIPVSRKNVKLESEVDNCQLFRKDFHLPWED